MFPPKDVSNFYVPSPLSSSASQKFESTRFETTEPASLPPYPYHENLETLAEGSVPNSPQRKICTESSGTRAFNYETPQKGSYGSQILEEIGKKNDYENVEYVGGTSRNGNVSTNGNCSHARDTLRRSNSENREHTRHELHPYENVQFQRCHQRSVVYTDGNEGGMQRLARSISETRESGHSYENVNFHKTLKGRNHSEDSCFEDIHIPRVTQRKRSTDFKVGGQVASYSAVSSSGSAGVLNKLEDGPSSLGADRSPGKKTSRRMNSRSVANIPCSSGSNLKAWHVSIFK